MSVEKMKDKPHGQPRKLPWRYRDRSAGVVRYFKTRKEAEEFQEENNSRKRRTGSGLPTTVKDLKKYTARDIVRSYMFNANKLLTEDDNVYDDKEELEDSCELPSNQFLVLWQFACRDVCELSLFDFNNHVAERYVEDRLKETYTVYGSKKEKKYTPRSVKRETATIQKAWKWARKLPGLHQLENPWEGIRVRGSTGGRRTAELNESEMHLLVANCSGCLGNNKYYLALAISLASETGMRRQEIENLTWEDIDFENLRIRIAKSKTDKATGNEGYKIVMTPLVMMELSRLSGSLYRSGSLPGPQEFKVGEPGELPSGRIIRISGNAISDAFEKTFERTGIKKDFRFHDLRRVANTMFYKAGLEKVERDFMRGKRPNDMDVTYLGEETVLQQIEDKLFRYKVGLTSKQIFQQRITEQQEFEGLYEEGIQQGLAGGEAIEKAKTDFLARHPDWKVYKEFLSIAASLFPEEQFSLASSHA